MQEYLITYSHYYSSSKSWREHSYRVKGEVELTKVMLSYVWEVVGGEFIINRVEKIHE